MIALDKLNNWSPTDTLSLRSWSARLGSAKLRNERAADTLDQLNKLVVFETGNEISFPIALDYV